MPGNPLPWGPTADGYEGIIPSAGAGTLVQFYVEAVDTLGQVTWYPAAGPESYAQYRVADGKARTTGVHNYRIVMRNEDRDFPLHLNEPDEQRSHRRDSDLQRRGGLLQRGAYG